ncbi:MAG: NADPH:quinone oxidoreductase family protein [Pseudomonadota bacterium]
MRAMRLKTLGAPLVLETVETPRPGPGEVTLDVAACGINFADTLVVQGRYQERFDLPMTPGMELSGHVTALGPGATAPAIGTRVAAFAGQGGLADCAVVPAAACAPVPDTLSDIEAAAFLVAYGTSHVALETRAGLRPGETLLVLGASGGVGLTAVEIGKHLGARVIAVARGREKLAVAEAAGADVLLDSDTVDLRAEVKALGGADVVYDPVGGDLFEAALRATNPGGRLIPIGFASGQVPAIPANILLVKNLTVIGLYWGAYLKLDPSVITESFARLFTWHAEGRLSPHVSHVLPLEEANAALDLLRNRAATGKVVVEIRR